MIAVAGLAVVALAPLLRFRRAGPVQRQQLKWFAFVVGACIVSALAAAAMQPCPTRRRRVAVRRRVASAWLWGFRSRSAWRSCATGCTTSTG